MIRIARRLLQNGSVMCPKRIDFHLVRASQSSPHLKYNRSRERETCPLPLPPPKPKPKDDSAFWGAVFLATVAAAFAVYAKRSPEIRDWLTIYAPWFDDFIAVLYQENMTYGEYAAQCLQDLKNYIGDAFSDEKSNTCLVEDTVKPISSVSEKPKEQPKDTKGEGEEPCKVLPPPDLTNDICDVEACLKDLYETVMNNYLTAKVACTYYNQLVEETMLDFSIPKLKELRKAMEERLELVKVSIKNATDAQEDMDDLNRYLDCGVQALPEAIEKTRTMMQACQEKVKAACVEFQWENDKSVVRDRQWQTVESVIDRYIDESEIMLPGLQYVENKLHLSGDPDLLLYHTYRYAQKLQEELKEAVAGMKDRVDRAVDSEKETQRRKSLIEAAIKRKRAEMEKEFNTRLEDQKKRNETILKEALNKQLQRHQEMLENKLMQREKENTRKLNKMVAEKVASEKRIFAKQLSEMTFKVKKLEDKLNAHLKAEKESRRSQDLWTAGASLLAATKKGYPCVRVDKELKAIQKASGGEDKLVTTVLKAIPVSVWDEGVVPESVLKQNYYQMEKTVLKVALVEQDGSPLPIYFLSWLQSALLFFKVSSIPQAEIDKPPKEPSEDLDTFDLMQRARFWLEKGNLAMAIQYVRSLEGASRVAAESWLKAARTHLEIRQAAEAIIAHAAALGLQYI
ncbi:unnamed protein product [Parnassius apollo]|uniref:MICOS complex subunit MIC60 n=1 Tax=Parnassius apollo TaxID=110799 RepID=A0A8S3WLT6_PARAO|nr:unnamed protein product [Parnassius apollo]